MKMKIRVAVAVGAVLGFMIVASSDNANASLFKSDEDKVIESGNKMTSYTEPTAEYLNVINDVMNECTNQIYVVNPEILAECATFFQGQYDTTKKFLQTTRTE